jgi:hypothetical protein
MSRPCCRLAFVLLVLIAGWATGFPSQTQSQARQSDHVRQGVRHFDLAFYELTSKRHDVEASGEFDLALAAFEAEVAARPASANIRPRGAGPARRLRAETGQHKTLTARSCQEKRQWTLTNSA